MATLKKFVPPVEFHPGITLSDKLKEMGMSVKEFAVRTSNRRRPSLPSLAARVV